MVESTTSGRVVVAETGNKRRNISDEDLAQCVKDIASWLQEKASDHFNQNMAGTANTATADDVSAMLSAFSASSCTHLALSLQKFNGGLHYKDNYIGLPLD